MVEVARKSGFVEVKHKILGRWWSLAGLINLYISKWIFRRKRFGEKFFIEKENEEFLDGGGFMNIFIVFKKK